MVHTFLQTIRLVGSLLDEKYFQEGIICFFHQFSELIRCYDTFLIHLIISLISRSYTFYGLTPLCANDSPSACSTNLGNIFSFGEDNDKNLYILSSSVHYYFDLLDIDE
jgi:hypothetical protein